MKNLHLIMRKNMRKDPLFSGVHPMSSTLSEASLKLADVEIAVRRSLGLDHVATCMGQLALDLPLYHIQGSADDHGGMEEQERFFGGDIYGIIGNGKESLVIQSGLDDLVEVIHFNVS